MAIAFMLQMDCVTTATEKKKPPEVEQYYLESPFFIAEGTPRMMGWKAKMYMQNLVMTAQRKSVPSCMNS